MPPPPAAPSRRRRVSTGWPAGPAISAAPRITAGRRSAARIPNASWARRTSPQHTAEHLPESEIRDGVLHVGHEAPPRTHVLVGHKLEGQRHPELVRTERRDPVSQLVTVKEHQA